ncbi:MAG: hypothetical protein KAY50_00405 [Chitinophagaceae bacterium]|nr:hypothetical protein [Chitinophagaceae bacterium]
MKYNKKVNYLHILDYQVAKFNEEFKEMDRGFRPVANFKLELTIILNTSTVSLGLYFREKKDNLFHWTVVRPGDLNCAAYQIVEYLNQFAVDHMYSSIHKMHKLLCEPTKM